MTALARRAFYLGQPFAGEVAQRPRVTPFDFEERRGHVVARRRRDERDELGPVHAVLRIDLKVIAARAPHADDEIDPALFDHDARELTAVEADDEELLLAALDGVLDLPAERQTLRLALAPRRAAEGREQTWP